MVKSLTAILSMFILYFGTTVSFESNAATVGCERAGGVKCQHVSPKRVKRGAVIVVPKTHRHYRSYHSPMLTALGIAIILDAAGNAVTEKGQQVVVLGEGNEVSNVYEKDGTVYLIKA
ncbi:hypothetical protein Ssed_2758 [Shewanella sediminis HAW-EB3]|uniref:Uncharacterized protein n=1 Tax=Shewanella sediminis (strain HAW-EB3) TaxID=425104 RepID=A8FWZ2_SHESH|nr:hypothetical protein [Shewanella sediminis]ABV37365.1 hypothetical protein Ssed_2758 [Shewanella sediminis HAW-EB3]